MIKTVITTFILLVTLTGVSCASHDEKQSVAETKLVISNPTSNSPDIKDQNTNRAVKVGRSPNALLKIGCLVILWEMLVSPEKINYFPEKNCFF